MRVAVYSCAGCEKEIFSREVIGTYKFRFFSKDLAIDTTCLAEGFNTIIISSADCLSHLVLNQLHRLQIKYIIFYNALKNNFPVEKAKALDIKLAYIPAKKEAELQDATADNYFDSFSISGNQMPLTAEFGKLVMETISGWKEGRKTRFDLY
jgi:hypothetical protein